MLVEMMDGWPEWLSVVPEPAARRRRRWSDISSARATYSDLLLLFMASRYRSIDLFMLFTRRLQVRGGVLPSSKKERGMLAALGRLKVENEVAEAIIGVWLSAWFVLLNGSFRPRAAGV